LNATISKPIEMLGSMTNWALIFLPRIMGLWRFIVEKECWIRNKEQGILNTATATEYFLILSVVSGNY
jgi:hypothetical protein